MDEQQYQVIRTDYISLSKRFLWWAVCLAIIIFAILITNKFCHKYLADTQPFFLLLSFAAFCIYIGQYFHYRNLLKDRLSDLAENPVTPGRNKTFERLTTNRKTVYNNIAFFWTGLAFFFPVLFILLVNLDSNSTDKKTAPVSNSKPFDSSRFFNLVLHYASIPTEEKVCKTLVAINKKTIKNLEPDTIKEIDYIRVYTLKDSDYYSGHTDTAGFYNTNTRYTWVFTKKEFFDKYKFYANEDSIYRLKQLLGFSPQQKIKKVITFLVKPKDLFRPCLDTEIDDCECNTHPTINSISNHQQFVMNWHIDNYFKYPFTCLGYTFDWNPYNLSHVGVSEFVIDTIKEIKLVNVMDVQDFLRKGMKIEKQKQ